MTASRTGPAQRCNIGTAELARRRRGAIALTAVTIVVGALLIGSGAPHVARLMVWPFIASAAVSWLQVVRRFCVRFGAIGVQNFGPLGEETPVDRASRAADRRHAITMIAEGALVGLAVTIAFVGFPA